MNQVIKIGVSGAGGYGYYYLKAMLEKNGQGNFELTAVFDPRITDLPILDELERSSTKYYADYDSFKQTFSRLDLVVIVSPIHFHASQCKDALNAGCNVLLDKPLSGSLQDALMIQDAERKSGKWVMVGYQWTFSAAIQRLKLDLISGKYGRIKKAKSLVLWPRSYEYYNRNDWAGKKNMATGLTVNDNPLNNAMAHFLHNLLYLCGENHTSSAIPIGGQAELFRAYNIETFDTGAILFNTAQEIQIGFYGSHVSKNPKGPLFILECQDAVIYYGELSNDIVAVRNDGPTVNYGDPDADDQFLKLWVAIGRCLGVDGPTCSTESALQHTKIIQALSDQVRVMDFSNDTITDLKDDRRYIDGLGYMLLSSYQQGVLPSKKNFRIKGMIQKFKI